MSRNQNLSNEKRTFFYRCTTAFNRNFLSFCIATFLIVTVHAQVVFGVKAGLNLSEYFGTGTSRTMIPGLHAGGFATISIMQKFALQPEVVFSTQGNKSRDGISTFTDNTNWIIVPILFKYYNNATGFFVETGPQIGFLVFIKEDDMTVLGWKYRNSNDFSWVLGAGFLFLRDLGLDVRYNLGLTNITKLGSNNVDRNCVLQLGIFYQFGKNRVVK